MERTAPFEELVDLGLVFMEQISGSSHKRKYGIRSKNISRGIPIPPHRNGVQMLSTTVTHQLHPVV
jgi:hypothetical protein